MPINCKEDKEAVKSQVPGSPYRDNGLSEEEQMERISEYFSKILETLGLDLQDDSIQKTPDRYAKMLVKELLWGLQAKHFPQITVQDNKFHYREMLTQTNISIHSICEHHFVPILGYCHIAYFPKEKIIGLSKLNRVAQYFAKRPQVQERLTKQIRECLAFVLETEDVAVVIDCLHCCVKMRGVQDADALTRSSDFDGKFLHPHTRQEFLSAIPRLQEFTL